MVFRQAKWWLEDRIFLTKMWIYDYIIDPIKEWYSDHYCWHREWFKGYYTIDEEDGSGNFWLTWKDEDTYVTPKDSYHKQFKKFENGTTFRCHLVWNSSKDRPQKIKDIEILRKPKNERQ